MIDLLPRVQAALGDAFVVEQELGGGGMSRLFLATEVSLNRRVVIKLLPPEMSSEMSAARFKQEMEFAARLQHPHRTPSRGYPIWYGPKTMVPLRLRIRPVSRSIPSALAAALLLAAGCLDVNPNTTTLQFDLTQGGVGDNWEVGAADYPVGREADVAVVGDRRVLPEAIGTAFSLYQSGTNVTGDLFVFQRKRWTGLLPNTTYQVSLTVEFVSNVHSGCTTGVGPGVVIKAGVTSTETLAEPDDQNVYRFSVNKGSGTAAGDFAQLGDIRNGLSGCPATGTYAVRSTATVRQPASLVTDVTGGFWMFIGTQSSAAARHEVYLTHVTLKLQ